MLFFFPSISFLLLLLFPSRHCHCMGKEIYWNEKKRVPFAFPHLDYDKDIATAFIYSLKRDDIDIDN